ncbi:C-C motif chemokine 14 [Nycticebus coucang]|uniref:C-C motif chemokine 14 n=1 Tax=Nycticebus coucang TaxID=9470 RepID=UPI00234C8A87|nr:C-C motif chemokine 14 [Nycticebus coucang]
MKVSMAAVFFLSLLLLSTTTPEARAKSSSRGPYHPAECCFTYVTHELPRHRISDYYETSSQCSKPGIVFITKKGHYICSNPSDKWVQDYVKDMEEN